MLKTSPYLSPLDLSGVYAFGVLIDIKASFFLEYPDEHLF